MSQPSIDTSRLILRAFHLDDAPAIQALAGDRAIADTTLNIPHPYEDGMAEEWVAGQETALEDGTAVTFAIVLRDEGGLIGAIGLRIDRGLDTAELGYWVGKPFWNRGYATEAAIALLAFGFEELCLNRIHASHLGRNPSSGRVMEKAGLIREGVARQDIKKWGKYEDLVSYAILRDDWVKR